MFTNIKIHTPIERGMCDLLFRSSYDIVRFRLFLYAIEAFILYGYKKCSIYISIPTNVYIFITL